MSGLDPISMATIGVQAGGTLLDAFGGYRSSMDQANAIDAQKPNDLLNAAYRSQGLKYAADTTRAGAQRQAQQQVADKNLLLSKAQAAAAASGGGATDTTVANIEGQIENQGEFYKALSMFPAEIEANQLKYESQNALREGINGVNAKTYQANQLRRSALLNAGGSILGGAATAFDRYGRYSKDARDRDIAIAEGYADAAKVRADYSAKKLQDYDDLLRRSSDAAINRMLYGQYR